MPGFFGRMSNWPKELLIASSWRRADSKPFGDIQRMIDITRLRPTDIRNMRPAPRRSSVTNASPALRAAAIDLSLVGLPPIVMSPCHWPGTPVPYRALKSSVRPAPITPASPTISPCRTSRSTLVGACHPGDTRYGRKEACRIRRSTSPTLCARRG